MSFLVSSPLEAVDILALCDYKAQEEICILYTEVSFFYTQNATPNQERIKVLRPLLVPILVFSRL